MMPDEGGTYVPIADYGVIGNMRSAALISRLGSIDWCCFPDLDRPSVFAAILDRRRGGRFAIAPAGETARGSQRYVPETNVLETTFDGSDGCVVLTDFMPVKGVLIGRPDQRPRPEIHRLVRCERGRVTVRVEWSPRFDYARKAPAISPAGAGAFEARAGEARLTIAGLAEGAVVARDEGGPLVRTEMTLAAGEQAALVCRWRGGAPRAALADTLAQLDETLAAWRGWVHTMERPGMHEHDGEWRDQLVRSGLALKLLTHRHTGAIAAAPTTSLPEVMGGIRNWDYRYTWLRDAAFTAQALYALGHRSEAMDFLKWVQAVPRFDGAGPSLQIMYGLHGERELPELVLDHLDGYRGSRPVRIGNAAATQRQLDIYGELLGAAYELVRYGGSVSSALWRFLSAVVDEVCELWREPDHGIWEVRGGPRHFVHSKLMVWVALDRAIQLARRFGLSGPLRRWKSERAAVRAAILEQGYDAKLGAFVQSFGSHELDAANLLIPVVEFLPFDDPRVQSTIDRTIERLTVNGLTYRYLTDDGLPGGEGAFGLTTFWLVTALALSGRTAQAREYLVEMAGHANHLGLYSEEFDPRTGEFLGNFPQAFTHIGFVNAALYLGRAAGEVVEVPPPVGTQAHRAEAGHEEGAAA